MVSGPFGSTVSFSVGVARWDESVLHLFTPSSSPSGCFVRPLSAVAWFSSLFMSLGFSLVGASFLLPSVVFEFSLSPSSSSMTSYHSLLGSVFCCVLYALSSHFGCLALLRCFRPSFPLSFSRIPPWRLLQVSFLFWGSPFLVSLSLPAPCGSPLPDSFGLGS